jgi:hypothetical protein
MNTEETQDVMRLQHLRKTLENALQADIKQRVDSHSFDAAREALDYVCHRLGVHSFAQIGA